MSVPGCLQFIDVEWSRNENPHEGNEHIHKSEAGNNFTAFNHFIDIKKGHGFFDDYDGYSYKRGSASKDEYQESIEKTDGFFASLAASISGCKVDEGLTGWWYNDEYVHINGQPGYNNCSPSLEAYSYPMEYGIYPDKISELKERFPLAKSKGETGMGIPYSVFMPVDNLGRYWYEVFLTTSDLRSLGPVMHAIQDASIPHHAAGYLGNWHGEYETFLEHVIKSTITSELKTKVMRLLDDWDRLDACPPARLEPDDWNLMPAINWRVDQLITWVALNAFRTYTGTYKHFNICDMPRYQERVRELSLPPTVHQTITKQIRKQIVIQMFQETIPEMQHLILIATAMSSFILLKAILEKPLELSELKRKLQRLPSLPDFILP
jgi:hypothetical protein